MNDEKVVIDLDAIPKYVRPYLLAPFFDAAKEYFKQPGMQVKYEQWLKEKETVGKREK